MNYFFWRNWCNWWG